MAFKSEAQRKKFQELVKSGQMDQEVLDAWNNATGKAKLPERVAPAPAKRSHGPHIAWAEKPTKAKKASKA